MERHTRTQLVIAALTILISFYWGDDLRASALALALTHTLVYHVNCRALVA